MLLKGQSAIQWHPSGKKVSVRVNACFNDGPLSSHVSLATAVMSDPHSALLQESLLPYVYINTICDNRAADY